MRAVVYARFSSELQDARSISDQIVLAERYIQTRSFELTGRYEDAAISGASTINRPGLQRLLDDAKAKRFDVIVTESLDRLSRSQADIAMLYERMSFYGVRIETLSDGAVSEIHVGLKGTMAALFLKDLAQKTRRGQMGRVRAGRIPGGKSYGYDIVRATDERGVRAINEYEASIVRRIFEEYGRGKGPQHIARDLNGEGIAGPTGKFWTTSALLGSPTRRNGLLNNELYRGVIIYNRQRFLKDPTTGKRVARANPETEWQRRDVPEFRIVEEEVWNAVQERRAKRGGPHLHNQRRPKRLLSGLLKCGCCGSSYSLVGKDYLRCTRMHNSGACENRRTVRMNEVEERVLTVLQTRLLAPDAVEAAVKAYAEERASLEADRRRRHAELTRDLAAAERKLKRIVDKIIEVEIEEARPLYPEMKALNAEKERLEAELAEAPRPDSIAVHPQAAAHYRQKVQEIHEALRSGDKGGYEAMTILRDLIDKIVVIPGGKGHPSELQVVGNIAGLLVENSSGTNCSESLVAGAGFEPTTFRL